MEDIPIEVIEETKVVEPVTETQVENTIETEASIDTTVEEPRRIKVKYDKEDRELTEEEAIPWIQKGMNYDRKEKKVTELEQELSELRLKESEREILTGKQALEKNLRDEGYDEEAIKKMVEPAFKTTQDRLDKERVQAEKTLMLAKRTTEKDSLKDKPFFKEVEKELDSFLVNPINAKVPLNVAYDVAVGRYASSPEFQDVIKNTKQSAIADYQDKSKRSGSMTSEGTPEDLVDVHILDEKSLEMVNAFGIDPKKIAKYVKETLKKKK